MITRKLKPSDDYLRKQIEICIECDDFAWSSRLIKNLFPTLPLNKINDLLSGREEWSVQDGYLTMGDDDE